MIKVGRNDSCPCGSGKKYKKCHGDLARLDRVYSAIAAASVMLARHKAAEQQRIEQQGLGKPIIAARMDNGHQFVAVRNRLLYSKKWKTFHDFLGDYLKGTLGTEWGNAELRKPFDQRHPILVWYHKLCEQQRLTIKEPGKVSIARMTGAVAAYMHLAYDLYALDHNAELQAKLVARLRSRDNFYGARYEVQVAAMLARAGFTIAFENEDDRSTSHCEFVITHPRTGKQFSVEAKRAESGRVIRQLVRALGKTANHTRIVFIDLNTPDPTTGDETPAYVQRAPPKTPDVSPPTPQKPAPATPVTPATSAWFLVRSKPRQESVALTHLARQGYDSYLPLFATEKLVRRKSTVVQEPMFARYLFVRLDTSGHERGQGQSWSPIRSTVGVSELVCFGSRPARVDDALIATLRERQASQQADPITLFANGDNVRITEGAFAGLDAIYQMNDAEGRAMVLLDLLSKPVAMTIDAASLRRVG